MFNYINPELLRGKNTDGDFEIKQMQGSAEINIKITAYTFAINAPFLRITEATNQVALLRKVAEVNFYPLRLAQIIQAGNELSFEYEMPLELAQPNKVYDLLRNVSLFADDYDDMFIEKYNADFYKKPSYTELHKSERKEVWTQISNVLEDYKNYTQFLKDKRWDDFQWDNIVISLLKLANMPYINGKLRSDLSEYVSNLFNYDLDFKFRVDKGNNFMKKLLEKSEEEIMKNVYHAEQLISLRWRSSKQMITDALSHNEEQVKKYVAQESNFNLSSYLQFVFLKLAYDYALEDKYKLAIDDVLEKVSGLSPDVAAPLLTETFYALLNGTVSETSSKKGKGFFSKLLN